MRLSITQAMRLTQLLRKVPSSYSSSYFDKNTNKAMNQYNKVSECKNHSKNVAQINKNMDPYTLFFIFLQGPGIGFPRPLGGKGFGDFETHPGLMPLYVCLWGFSIFLVWFCSRSLFTNPEVDWAKGKMEPGQTPQDAYRYKQYRLNIPYLNIECAESDPKTQCPSPVIPDVTAKE